MFEEPEDQSSELASDPTQRAREKAEEFCLHAELAAVFEGPRKFDAQLCPGLDPNLTRDIQRSIGRLEKTKSASTGPLLPPSSFEEAAGVLEMPKAHGLTTGDYHIHQRPGEVMIIRWLEAEQVERFYERIQAHFDVALKAYREEERAAREWKQDPDTLAYLDALDKVEIRMQERYLRPMIRRHGLFVLSTLLVDEMDILHLCDYLMGLPAAQLVGEPSAPPAPPAEPTDQDRAWFFKLFALRGIKPAEKTGADAGEDTEQMCFFTYMQKTSDEFGW